MAQDQIAVLQFSRQPSSGTNSTLPHNIINEKLAMENCLFDPKAGRRSKRESVGDCKTGVQCPGKSSGGGKGGDDKKVNAAEEGLLKVLFKHDYFW